MIHLGRDERRKSRLVRTGGRVWHLIVMLCVTVVLMLASWKIARHRQILETEVLDQHGTARVPDTQAQHTVPEVADESEAVQLSRLVEFTDHSRNIDPDSYYYLLDLAGRNSPAWLETHARRDVSYAQLFRDPDKYRGQLLFLTGRLRRLVVDDCGPNDYGLTVRYEGWLFTPDSGQLGYAVIVTEPPRGMPLGAIYENVSVAGYFLGWWRHQNKLDKPTSSPVILANRFHWIQQSAVAGDKSTGARFGLAVGAAIVLAALVVVWATTRDRLKRPDSTSGDVFVFQENSPNLPEDIHE